MENQENAKIIKISENDTEEVLIDLDCELPTEIRILPSKEVNS